MKNRYLLLAASLLGLALPAAAQRPWQPFRPGLIYTYHAVPATPDDEFYTLRVDSAYAGPGGDSVYVFNRLMRNRYAGLGSGAFYFYKSRNNQFGRQLRWRPGTGSFTLEATAEATIQNARGLELRPRAAVGSTWLTGTGTATLVSRGWQAIGGGVQDTVAVISIGSPGGTAQTVRLSRLHGLLAAPQWLGAAVGAPAVALEQAKLPVSFVQSDYNPMRFFDVQVGDEFGYEETDVMTGFSCWTNTLLRRVTARRQTADSLIITYLEQSKRHQLNGGPCGGTNGPPATTVNPTTTQRWAVALAGNQLQTSSSVLQLGILQLLTGEYAYVNISPSTGNGRLMMGRPLTYPPTTALSCAGGIRSIRYIPLYRGATDQFQPGVDAAAWSLDYTPGLTRSREQNNFLTYSRRTVNGQTATCGSAISFVGLLPSRAAQAAAVFSLYPNPAQATATLQLHEPAAAHTTLCLRDALGRAVWQHGLSAGQRSAEVPLADLPAGIYLVQLAAPGEAPVSLRLVKEQL